IPTLIELALISLDVFLRHMMRRVQRACGEVDEEWLVGSQCMPRLHPGDGLVGHVYREVVVGIMRRLHSGSPVKNRRRPLIGLATDEAVELVEPRLCRPPIERTRD